MPRGKKKFKPQPQASPVVSAAKQLASLSWSEREMALEVCNELIGVQKMAAASVIEPVVDVGEAFGSGKRAAAPAKRAIKRASKKRLANEPAAPIKEKSQLTLQFGKGKKNAAPAGE